MGRSSPITSTGRVLDILFQVVREGHFCISVPERHSCTDLCSSNTRMFNVMRPCKSQNSCYDTTVHLSIRLPVHRTGTLQGIPTFCRPRPCLGGRQEGGVVICGRRRSQYMDGGCDTKGGSDTLLCYSDTYVNVNKLIGLSLFVNGKTKVSSTI